MQQDMPSSDPRAKRWVAVFIFAAIHEAFVILLAVLTVLLRFGINEPSTIGTFWLPALVIGSILTVTTTLGFGIGLLLSRDLARRSSRRLYVFAGVAAVVMLIAAPLIGALVEQAYEYIQTTFHFQSWWVYRVFSVGYWIIIGSAITALAGVVAVLSLALSKRRDS